MSEMHKKQIMFQIDIDYVEANFLFSFQLYLLAPYLTVAIVSQSEASEMMLISRATNTGGSRLRKTG